MSAIATLATQPTPRLRQALVPTLLFWTTWAVLHWQWPHARWLGVTAQMWLAYSAAWIVLPTRWWPVSVPLMALVGAVVGLIAVPGFGAAQWMSAGTVASQALAATAFALLMHLPIRWWRWREEQALHLRVRQAEHTAAMAELSRQVSLSELKALQAQVEPHFLFNALASLQQLIRQKPDTAERFLGELHNYLRLALPSMREPMSTVDKELALARSYLSIMATRFGGRLRFTVKAGPGCADHPLPPMMLLTLVENAVQHGIEPLARGGEVGIEARREGERLVLEVRDDGAGLFGSVQNGTQGQGVGLVNVRDRLASLYGDAAHLRVEQRDKGGVSARIALPWSGPAGSLGTQ